MNALAELERSHDGPVPAHLRAVASAGGALPLALRHARADMRVWNRFVHDTIACLRIARRTGTRGRMARLDIDLAYYRRHRKTALQRLVPLRQQETAQRKTAA